MTNEEKKEIVDITVTKAERVISETFRLGKISYTEANILFAINMLYCGMCNAIVTLLNPSIENVNLRDVMRLFAEDTIIIELMKNHGLDINKYLNTNQPKTSEEKI